MFGYVRPLRGELKVRELEQYRAMYCGLCHTLGRRYGRLSRFVLNYEFTFLAMLMSEADAPRCEYRRCVSSPLRKRCLCCETPSLELAADLSVILGWRKLEDTVADEGFFKSLGARAMKLFLRRSYRKAARRRPEFDRIAGDSLGALGELERAGSPSLDGTADKFAQIVAAAAETAEDETRRRILRQILYHTGRWVYIVDACDDLEADLKTGSYNAVAARFGLKEPVLADEDLESVKTTLSHSAGLASSAFELMEAGYWTGVLGNIFYLGLPSVGAQVLSGTWPGRDKEGVVR